MPPPAMRTEFPERVTVVAVDFPPMTTPASPRETSGASGASGATVVDVDEVVVEISPELFRELIPDREVVVVDPTGFPTEGELSTALVGATVVVLVGASVVVLVGATVVVLLGARVVVLVGATVVALVGASVVEVVEVVDGMAPPTPANEIMVEPEVPLYVVVIEPTTMLPEILFELAKRVPLSLNPRDPVFPCPVAVSVESAHRKVPLGEYEAMNPSPNPRDAPAVVKVVVPKTAFLVVLPNAPKYPAM